MGNVGAKMLNFFSLFKRSLCESSISAISRRSVTKKNLFQYEGLMRSTSKRVYFDTWKKEKKECRDDVSF